MPESQSVLAPEIERVQNLLKQLDELVARGPLALKDLSLAIDTASSGGRALAALYKSQHELGEALQDQEYECLRARLFALVERLARRRESRPDPDGEELT